MPVNFPPGEPHRRSLRFALAAAVIFFNCEVKAADIYDNGAPDHINGSDMGDSVEADDFAVSEAVRFDGVRFWNLEGIGSFAGAFTWQIYSNTAADKPGDLIAGGVSINLAHTATGGTSFGFSEFVNDFSVSPVYLRPGIYWLGLHNGTLDNVS